MLLNPDLSKEMQSISGQSWVNCNNDIIWIILVECFQRDENTLSPRWRCRKQIFFCINQDKISGLIIPFIILVIDNCTLLIPIMSYFLQEGHNGQQYSRSSVVNVETGRFDCSWAHSVGNIDLFIDVHTPVKLAVNNYIEVSYIIRRFKQASRWQCVLLNVSSSSK